MVFASQFVKIFESGITTGNKAASRE